MVKMDPFCLASLESTNCRETANWTAFLCLLQSRSSESGATRSCLPAHLRNRFLPRDRRNAMQTGQISFLQYWR